jgi:hypothetical protein
MSPWDALTVYKRLLRTIPPNVQDSFDYIHAWLAVACTHATAASESILKAKWQSPHVNRRMILWMRRHTQYVNAMPDGTLAQMTGPALDPQECLNKALETVTALKPSLGPKHIHKRSSSDCKKHAPSRSPEWRQSCLRSIQK